MFGRAHELAELAWLSRADYALTRSWLFRCEELLRRLLLLDALALAPIPSLTLGTSPASKGRGPARSGRSFQLVATHVSSPVYGGGGARKRAGGGSSAHRGWRVLPALPLARRLAALTRALEQRDTLARRMARLWSKAKPTLVRLARPPLSYQRRKTEPGDLANVDAAALLDAALKATGPPSLASPHPLTQRIGPR